MAFRSAKELWYPVCWTHAICVRHERKLCWSIIRLHGTFSESSHTVRLRVSWIQNQTNETSHGGELKESFKHEQGNIVTNYCSSPSTHLQTILWPRVQNLSRFKTGLDNVIRFGSWLPAGYTDQKSCLWFEVKSKLRQLHTCVTPHHCTHCRQGAQHYCPQYHCQSQQHQAVCPVSGFSTHISKKRIPLAYTDEINQVLDDYADVIQEFAMVMGCSEAEMRDMVRRDTRLVTQFPKHEVVLKMRLLIDHGFPASQILKKYQLFSRSLTHIKSCLEALESVKHYRQPLTMLLLSGTGFRSRLAKYQREVAVMGPHHTNQASFVAELLECTHDELATLIEEKKGNFLLTLSPSRLKEMVGMLTSFGVSVEMIRQQPGMLRCSPGIAMERLRRAEMEGVLKPRLIPYILTNSDTHVDATLPTWRRNTQALLGYSDEQQLLMDRLECSEKDLESLLRRKPLVRSMTASKLKDCLGVLLEEVRLTPKVVLLHGELLYFSPRRLRARWALLQPLCLPESAIVKDLVLPERKFVAKYGCGTY